jgi:UDP-2-acetamido-3-amino-2,3-dideoxy-glucuronate N-acetyltransferase
MSERSAPGVAVIGAGYWGRNLIRNFAALGALRAICDHTPGPVALQQAEQGITLYRDWQQVLGDPAVSAVAIALPPDQHHAVAHAALLAKRDVYVEKPLCLTLADGEDLVATAASQQRMLVCGHLLRYQPHVEHLLELARDGSLGTLHHITARRLNLGPVFTERNALWNFAPHDLSLVLALAGDRLPLSVRAEGLVASAHGGADTVSCHLRFDDGLLATVESSWLHPIKEQRLTVVGSQQLAVFDDTVPWEHKLGLLAAPDPQLDGRHLPPAAREPSYVDLPPAEPLQRLCQAFLTACQQRKPARTDGREALRVLSVLQAAQTSLDQDGQAVTVPDRPSAATSA